MAITAKLGMTPGMTVTMEGERASAVKGSSVRVTEIALPASAWVSVTDTKHKQVVDIDIATPYSLVDLQPSDDQLVIFRGKEIAFTAENDGGVVTVVAIGDKPTNDYIMQATLTEVTI